MWKSVFGHEFFLTGFHHTGRPWPEKYFLFCFHIRFKLLSLRLQVIYFLLRKTRIFMIKLWRSVSAMTFFSPTLTEYWAGFGRSYRAWIFNHTRWSFFENMFIYYCWHWPQFINCDWEKRKCPKLKREFFCVTVPSSLQMKEYAYYNYSKFVLFVGLP